MMTEEIGAKQSGFNIFFSRLRLQKVNILRYLLLLDFVIVGLRVLLIFIKIDLIRILNKDIAYEQINT